MLLFSVTVTVAQTNPIKVGDNVQVSTANATLIHEQPVVDVDPDNPQHLIACSHMFTSEPDVQIRGIVYISFDGGRSWVKSLQAEGEGLHPWCAFGHGGLAYVTTLGRSACHPNTCTYSTVELYRSTDGGRNWTKSEGYYHAGDHPYLTVDNISQKYRGTIYVSTMLGAMPYDDVTANHDWISSVPSGVAVYVSTDQGKSFSAPVSAYSSNGHDVPIMGATTVMADGTYVLMFPELMDSHHSPTVEHGANERENAWIKVAISRDSGKTLEPASVVATTNWGVDGGFSSPLQQGIAADISTGPFGNRLYVVWAAKELKRHRIWLSHSDDTGKTWSSPVAVDDGPANPSGGPNDFMPAVAVNGQGVVGIVWYDRRDNPDGLGWFTRFTVSLDGGETFLPSMRVSTAPMSFVGRHQATFTGRFFKNVYDNPTGAVGYSLGFAASPDGAFHAVWTDNRTGTPQLWTAPVIVSGTVLRNGSTELSDLVDVSSRAPVHIGSPQWDWSTGKFECDLFVKNTSAAPIAGPIKLRLLHLDSALGVLDGAKVDGRAVETGSVLEVSQNGLKSGEWSKPLHFTGQVKVLFGPHDPDAEERLQRIFTIDSKTFAPPSAGKQ
jgi:hypothetical protein